MAKHFAPVFTQAMFNTSHHRVTHHGLALQDGIRQMLREQDRFTHWVTLSFNTRHTPENARRILQWWSTKMIARMFRSPRFHGVPTRDLFFFFAFPEDTLKENPHFHLLVRVVASRAEYFQRIGAGVWKLCVPSGDSDIQAIRESDADHDRVQAYATKNANRAFSHDGFIASTMLYDIREQASLTVRGVAHA